MYTIKMSNLCTCIIPFYNENPRIVSVLKELVKVKNLSEIICVDDGSTDNTGGVVRKYFPHIKIIRLVKNQGKTTAIKTGLLHIKSDTILLVDADLQGLDNIEITNAINRMHNTAIDMIILRRMYAPAFLKINRSDILISGERILRRQDLLNVLALKPKKFQLEMAINKYMMNAKKNVSWMPSSAMNTFKIDKFNFSEAFAREMNAYEDIVSYAGVTEYLEQVAFFCHRQTQ